MIMGTFDYYVSFFRLIQYVFYHCNKSNQQVWLDLFKSLLLHLRIKKVYDSDMLFLQNIVSQTV